MKASEAIRKRMVEAEELRDASHAYPNTWARHNATRLALKSALELVEAQEREQEELMFSTRDICWHCHDVLAAPDSPPHCEHCPAECDEPDCDAVGCYGHNGESRGGRS